MIQLTKGTNVLDINLSDFSGAGQDVVQNGSFNDIGSDLVQNGDFAEIGSELVTNGDFSAVPLTGGELATFSLGNISLNNKDGSISTSLGGIDYRSVAISDTNDARPRVQFDNLTEGKSYKIVYTPSSTSGASDFDLFQNGVRVVFNHDISLPLTFSLLAGASGNRIDFNGTNTFTTEYTLSIIEEINLVTNPNFTDTGAEMNTLPSQNVSVGNHYRFLPYGTNTIAYDGSGVTTITYDNDPLGGYHYFNDDYNFVSPLVTTEGKSYLATITCKVNSGTFDILLSQGSGASGVAVATGVSNTDYVTYSVYFVAGLTETSWIRCEDLGTGQVVSINNVSIKELGEDWTLFSDVSVGEDKLICDNVAENTSIASQSGIVPTEKSVKVSYDVVVDSGAFRLLLGSGGTTTTVTTSGTYVFYETSGLYGTLTLQARSGGFDGSITNIVVQELGEGWTVSTTGSSTLQFNSNGAAFNVVGGDYVLCRQDYGFINGKSYKLVITFTGDGTSKKFSIKDDGGSLGGLNEDITISSLIPTTQTFYFTANSYSDTTLIKRLSGGEYSFSVSSISVKEVGQDWTVQEGWTVEDNKAVCDGLFNNYIGQFFSLPTGSIKVTFEVDSYTSGTLNLWANIPVFTKIISVNTVGTYEAYFTTTSGANNLYFYSVAFIGSITNVQLYQLDTNNRWVTFADPDSKSVMKLGQVDLEIDSSGNNCGVYQTGLIKPNKLYIITINMKATAAINVEIAASLGTAVSAVIGTELLTTSYKEYSFEYVTPFAVDHDLQIHRLFGSGANQTISIDYVSMNGVDESQWTNDPTWNPFATSLVFVPTLTDESTNNSKQFTLDTSITDGGWDGRSLHGQVIINQFPTEVPASGIINLKQPDFLEGFYQVEIRGYLGTFYRVLGKCMAHLERTSTEDGYNRFESYNDTVTYKAYEE